MLPISHKGVVRAEGALVEVDRMYPFGLQVEVDAKEKAGLSVRNVIKQSGLPSYPGMRAVLKSIQ